MQPNKNVRCTYRIPSHGRGWECGSLGAKGKPQVDLVLRVPLLWHVLDSLLSKQISTAFIELYN